MTISLPLVFETELQYKALIMHKNTAHTNLSRMPFLSNIDTYQIN